ncbi:MAG: hypothetical protein ACRCYQ_03220 [Nocardioides sp.]
MTDWLGFETYTPYLQAKLDRLYEVDPAPIESAAEWLRGHHAELLVTGRRILAMDHSLKREFLEGAAVDAVRQELKTAGVTAEGMANDADLDRKIMELVSVDLRAIADDARDVVKTYLRDAQDLVDRFNAFGSYDKWALLKRYQQHARVYIENTDAALIGLREAQRAVIQHAADLLAPALTAPSGTPPDPDGDIKILGAADTKSLGDLLGEHADAAGEYDVVPVDDTTAWAVDESGSSDHTVDGTVTPHTVQAGVGTANATRPDTTAPVQAETSGTGTGFVTTVDPFAFETSDPVVPAEVAHFAFGGTTGKDTSGEIDLNWTDSDQTEALDGLLDPDAGSDANAETVIV